MILKIFKALWFLSMLAVLANLLYVYAGWPEEVAVYEDQLDIFYISREALFYGTMLALGVINLLVYMFPGALIPNENFRVWVHALVMSLNIFFLISISFVGLYNSSEKFDFGRIGWIIYSSIVLLILTMVSWPLVWIFRKILSKPVV
ncbi:MAG: hypothetical protein ACK4RF_06060 [Cyclobacteriaceae bacterium]